MKKFSLRPGCHVCTFTDHYRNHVTNSQDIAVQLKGFLDRIRAVERQVRCEFLRNACSITNNGLQQKVKQSVACFILLL